MTAPVMGDLVAAARACLAAPPRRRRWTAIRIVREAEKARAFRRKGGGVHPIWGDGTVMAAALRRPVLPAPGLGCDQFRACLVACLDAMGAAARQCDAGDPSPTV